MAEKVMMIALSPTMEEGTIAHWIKKEGESVQSGDILCEVETDKATMEYETTQEGTLLKIVVDDGGKAGVGQTIAVLGEPGEVFDDLLKEAAPATPKDSSPTPAPAVREESQTTVFPDASIGGRIKISPLAKRLAKDSGMDIHTVQGSGPGGRIIKKDLDQLAAPQTVGANVSTAVTAEAKRVPLSGKRKIIAERLAESKYTAPHYYLKLKLFMDGVLTARKSLNARASAKVSLNAFIIKLVAEALRKHPMVNSSWQGDHIFQPGTVDIGLAVAQPDGLITPVVRHCLAKGIGQIDNELKVLIEKAKTGKLQPEEYTGATFTISNLGSFGIEEFTAIINPPGSAILALGETRKTPLVDDEDNIIIQNLMKVSLSCDHRVIDGALGAAFMSDLKGIFENPIQALY